ncbi:MAG: GyrI-like domain-containing protein [Candidatus Eremiobacteraeota bacterium]|nr:GyrI-like domain-containing protein [Candidatus Eremiobacteraeota bacterium]
MTGTVEIRKLKQQPVVSIRRTTTMAQLPTAFGEILPRVFQELQRRGVQPAGPPFGRYHSFSSDSIDLEAGLPVTEVPAVEAPLQASALPACEAAVLVHMGPYDNLKSTYDALRRWFEENGREPGDGPWEYYVTDPMSEPDSSKWKTEVIWPFAP